MKKYIVTRKSRDSRSGPRFDQLEVYAESENEARNIARDKLNYRDGWYDVKQC